MFPKAILNYLFGNEEPLNQNELTNPTRFWKNIGLYRTYLKTIWIFFFPKLLTTSTFLFFILLASLFVTEVIVYQVGLLGGKFYKVLTSKDLPGFRGLAFIAIAYIVFNASLRAFNVYLTNLLNIVWRKTTTFTIHNLYFHDKQFYYLHYPQVLAANLKSKSNNSTTSPSIQENDSNIQEKKQTPPIVLKNRRSLINESSTSVQQILVNSEPVLNQEHIICLRSEICQNLDNPDQRITQDVKSLCESITSIVPLILMTPFLIGWYGYQTFQAVGFSGPLSVFIYFVFWGIINGPLAAPIARLVYKQDKLEGDFRYKHMNLRTNAETIAFYNSSTSELKNLNSTFESLLNISYRRNWKEFILLIVVNISQYMGGIVAYLILAIPIFLHVYDDKTAAELGQLINNYSFKCQYLIYIFTRFYNTFDNISNIAGNTRRIGELVDSLKTLSNRNDFQPKTNGTSSSSEDISLPEPACIEFVNVTVETPDQKTLIKEMNLKINRGQNVLITGKSGCGKTSLFRCINGLWNCHSGHIILNKNLKIFFLPQTSYFTNDSLLHQIIYPSYEFTDQNDYLRTIDKLAEWLRIFNLEHLLEKVKNDINIIPDFNWSNILSAGEKQRLSFLRILYHRPDFVLLDECTSSVDQEMENIMYEHLTRLECTYMSIAHRNTVRKFHNTELKFSNDAKYELYTI